MNENTIKLLMKAEIDPKKLAQNVNLIYLLADIQETLILRVEQDMKKAGAFKFQDKVHVQNIKRLAGEMRVFVDKTVSYECAVEYGNDCDELLNVIENYISNTNHEK
jgi:hypothetical protein